MSSAQGNPRAGDEIVAHARQLLVNGAAANADLGQSGKIDQALAVLAPDGKLHSWFVPVTVGDRLAAFFQFLPDGTQMRFSSFQRHPGSYAHCPAAEDWLNPDRIRARAAAHLREGEVMGEPRLTYDRNPDRLVWAVPFQDRQGASRLIYVAGEAAYLPPEGDSFG